MTLMKRLLNLLLPLCGTARLAAHQTASAIAIPQSGQCFG